MSRKTLWSCISVSGDNRHRSKKDVYWHIQRVDSVTLVHITRFSAIKRDRNFKDINLIWFTHKTTVLANVTKHYHTKYKVFSIQ